MPAHCDARKELIQRIRDGQIGDINLLLAAATCMAKGRPPPAFSEPRPANIPELHYQIRRFHSFLWASGGAYSDFLIHNIDECCWMKDAWPVSAKASGGRHYRGNNIDQNFDSYSVEYTFADGRQVLPGRPLHARRGNEFASYAHGTRGSAIISQSGHSRGACRTFRTQNCTPSNTTDVIWRYPLRDEPSPYQLEWDHLMAAIRNNQPYNEVARGAEASLITAMGRMAAHTAQIIMPSRPNARLHARVPRRRWIA